MGTVLLGGCASGVTNPSALDAKPQPRPDTLYVYPFALRPDQVELDTAGIVKKLQSGLGGASGAAEQAEAAAEVQGALADAIVQKLQAMGLRAIRANVPPPPGQNVLMVEGAFVKVDEGNRRRRVVIGLGAGKSEVGASVQVLYQPALGAPAVVQRFDAAADSGHMPGVAETAGVGAAAGRLATSAAVGGGLHGLSEKKHASLTALAGKMADSIAKQVAQVGVSQGWLAADRIDGD
jgi:hypothetical protein